MGHRCQDQGCHQGSQVGTGEGQEGGQEAGRQGQEGWQEGRQEGQEGCQEGRRQGQEGWQEGCQETETQGREGCYPLQGDRPCQARAGRGERYQEGCQLWRRVRTSSVQQAEGRVPRGCPGRCRRCCSPLIVLTFRNHNQETRVFNRVLISVHNGNTC